MSDKKIKEFKLMTKEQIMKARAERDLAIKQMKAKLAEAKLKEDALKNELLSEKRRSKITNVKNKKLEKIKLMKQLDSIKKNKASIDEDIRLNREKIKLMNAEIRNKNIEIKREFLVKKKELKEESIKRREEDRKKLMELKAQQAEVQREMFKTAESKKQKMTEEIAEINKKIAEKKLRIIKAEQEFRDNRKKESDEAILERKAAIIAKREEQAQMKLQLKKLKAKLKSVEEDIMIAKEKKDAELEKELLEQQAKMEQEKEVIDNSIATLEEKIDEEIINAEAGTINIVPNEDGEIVDEEPTIETEVPVDTTMATEIIDEQITSDAQEVHQHEFQSSLISEYGKPSLKLFEKAETRLDQTMKSRYTKNIDVYEMITKFEEHEQDSISIKSIMRYIYVLNDWKIDEEQINMLYQRQITAILYGNPVKLGDGYVQATKVKKVRICRYKHEIDQQPSSIFDEKTSKDYNELIVKKLKQGSPIKIGEGLMLVRENNGSVISVQDTNFTGA